MTTLSTKEIQKQTQPDLLKLLAEKREALRKFRFGIAGSKNRNMKEGQNLKKEIAKILAALKSKEIK
jgi:ribosomal protein L29